MYAGRISAWAIIGLMIASSFLAFLPSMTEAQEVDACKNYGTNANITFTPAWNNPVYSALNCEPTMLYNASAGWIDEWWASGTTYGSGGFIYLWYAHTTNANFTTHTTPARVLDNIRFPFIVKDNDTGIYYCFGHIVIGGVTDMSVSMWTSHNKTGWTLANGGKPVLYKSANGDDIHQWMANPTVVIVNHVFYLWIECANDSIISDAHGFGIGYSYSAVSTSVNFTHNATEYQVIEGGGSQNAQYVPDRNAIVIFWHKHSGNPFASVAKVVASIVKFNEDKALPSRYFESTAISIGIWNQYTADFTMAITPNRLVMQFFHCQPYVEDIYQMNCTLTLNALYDYVLSNTTYTLPSTPPSTNPPNTVPPPSAAGPMLAVGISLAVIIGLLASFGLMRYLRGVTEL